ncbi:MAG TPA: phosphoglucosamine mutase [Spirochaetes bacterium]|nr:phosphoglucosamine mutase [Spirochaetota bacterium]
MEKEPGFLMPLMVSVSGVRGIIGEDLTPPVIIKFVESFIHTLGNPAGKILIGRDTRKSGNFIENIVEGSIIALGHDVINIGIAATPTVLLLTRKLNCSGGIAITASHNPLQWNALKFCDEKGLFLVEKDVEKIRNRVFRTESPDDCWSGFKTLGTPYQEKEASLVHIEDVLKHIDHDHISEKKFKIAIDPAGGAGCVISRPFLEKLGCTVIGINEKSMPVFPRGPEPVPENLSKLCDLVISSKADIGFAQDPDGDRLAVVSESGVAIGEEYTLVLAGDAYLRKHRTNIACNLSTSMMIDDLAKRYSVDVFRTKIGEMNVTARLLENKISFGGEGNGGVIVPEINPCRDSITAMGLILELLAATKATVSGLVEGFPSYTMKKVKVPAGIITKDEFYKNLFESVENHFPGYTVDTLDGIKISNGSEWLQIRFSNTEPVVRIMSESSSADRAEELIKIGKTLVDN